MKSLTRRSVLCALPGAALAPQVAHSSPSEALELSDWHKRLIALTQDLNDRERNFVMVAAEVINDQRSVSSSVPSSNGGQQQ